MNYCSFLCNKPPILKCIVYNINHSKFDAKEKWSLICIQFRYVHTDKVFNAFYHQLSDKINGQKSSVISINSEKCSNYFQYFHCLFIFIASSAPMNLIWLPIMFVCLIMHPPCLCTQMHFFIIAWLPLKNTLWYIVSVYTIL